MGSKFSDGMVRQIGVAGLFLSGVALLIIGFALVTGNFDKNVVSLLPTTILGVAIYLGTQTVLKQRAGNDAG
ncbi:MAG: hypothetical protein IBJ12_05635 [Sphingomonadaceae bacterium]|nr:hypothetical protein [Sphingomonadaceae bacterium]